MKNLLQETVDTLKSHYNSPEDVLYIKDNENYTTWGKFSDIANIEYDEGYGNQEVEPTLMIVGKDFWLERHEYDGSEWWEYKSKPVKPDTQGPVTVFSNRDMKRKKERTD